MARALVTIHSRADREKVARWAMGVSTGARVEFKAPKRTNDQNSLMWAMLTDVATQVRWHGVKLTADDWKLVFLDALKREVRIVPNIDGTGFVNLGRSSSDLSKQEMSDMIELIHAFGANHGVAFKDTNPPPDPAEKAPAEPHKVSPDTVTSTAGAHNLEAVR